MMAIVRRLMRLDWRSRTLLAEAAAAHTAIVVLLRVWPNARVVGWRKPAAGPERRALQERVAWAVRTVAARTPGSSCLTAALTADLLLKGHGCDSVLSFGVARPTDASHALVFHAWIECGGRVIIGGETIARYRALESCSATAARIANSTALAGK